MMTEPNGGRKGWKIGALIAAALLVVGGGVGLAVLPTWAEQSNERIAEPASESSSSTPSAPAPEPLELQVFPEDEAAEVNPVSAPKVAAENGTIESVELTAAGGDSVLGEITDAGQMWTASERLEFNTEYTLTYTVTDGAGVETSDSRTFTTVVPANEANAWTYPLDGMTVGVGQPIQITFSEPVLNKAEVEEAIAITTTADQAGDFHWYSDQMLRYRPQEFWTANSTITIDFQLFGVEFGNGMIGNFDSSVTVNIGDSKVAVVDNTTKQMKAYFNGELVRTMPVTLGMDEWPSTSGVHVVMDQQREAEFNAGTIGLEPGDEHYYPPLTVEYASRISNGGEFVHSALEAALPYIGNTNVSHGCVGLFEKDAAWFFNNFTTGDVVDIRNTGGGALQPLDGFGDWNLSWETWTQ